MNEAAAVRKALEKLKTRNESDPDIEQVVSPAEPFPRGVPTLEKGVYRPPSPQLRARFEFAGDWKEAWLNQTWLGPKAMARAWTHRAMRKQLGIRKKDWEGSVFERHAPSHLALFGIQPEDFDETYLVWGDDPDEEPTIVEYFGQGVSEYKSLLSYVRRAANA